MPVTTLEGVTDLPVELIEALRTARKVVALTGAGVSAESGIATFRDKLAGLWSLYNPAKLASAEAFMNDPALVWGWYQWRANQIAAASPNAGHVALARWADHNKGFQLVTQNVDDLHEQAGSSEVLHLHGELAKYRCFDCGALFSEEQDLVTEPSTHIPPPHCKVCGGLIRPGVVWFGEELPQDVFAAAIEKSAQCDVFLCIGTSSLVYPAADLPLIARRHGAVLCVINIGRTPIDRDADYVLRGSASIFLPMLLRQI